MNIGEYVTHINGLSRQLTKISASSFADKAVLYRLATDIMLEANKIREITQERDDGRTDKFFTFYPLFSNSDNPQGGQK